MDRLGLSVRDVAAAVGAWLKENEHTRIEFDENSLQRLIRGEIRRPGEHVRAALRAVLRLSTDEMLGFVKPTSAATVDDDMASSRVAQIGPEVLDPASSKEPLGGVVSTALHDQAALAVRNRRCPRCGAPAGGDASGPFCGGHALDLDLLADLVPAGFWDRPDVKAGLDDLDFSAAFRELVAAVPGLQQQHVAVLTGLSPSQVSEVVNRKKGLSAQSVRRVATALGIGPERLGFPRPTSRVIEHGGEALWVLLRRVTAATNLGAGRRAGPVQVEEISKLHGRANQLRLRHRTLGGGACIEEATAAVAQAWQVCSAPCDDRMRSDVELAAAAVLCAAALVVADNDGDVANTNQDTETAHCRWLAAIALVEHSTHPQRDDLLAHAWLGLAELDLHRMETTGGDQPVAADMLLAALRAHDVVTSASLSSVCTRTRTYMAVNVACCYAMTGIDASAMMTRRWVSPVPGHEPEPAWAREVSDNELTAWRGRAHLALARTRPDAASTAAKNLEMALAGYEGRRQRSQALARARLCLALMRVGDVAGMVQHSQAAVADISTVRSGQMIRIWQAWLVATCGLRDDASVRQMRERVASAIAMRTLGHHR